MKIKKFIIVPYAVILLFTFIYTLSNSVNVSLPLNTANMAMLFVVFLIWLYAWYLFFIRDIIKSDQTERNRIGTALILIGIIFFYYNPLPMYEEYNIYIDRIFYFIITILSFITFAIASYKKKFFITIILFFIPITINSFFVNILDNYSFYDKFPYFTTALILFLLFAYFGYTQFKKSKSLEQK